MTDTPTTERIILRGMNSPNVIKVVLMLEECALDYEMRHVAVFNQEQFTPAFLAMNPLGKVPVLEDPQLGRPLAESGAILFWLAEREAKFLPTTAQPRAEVMQWLMVQMANLGPMVGQANHFRMAMDHGAEPYSEARYLEISAKLFRLLDERLANNEWLAGGDYSIADMATHPWAYYLEMHGFDPAEHPALVAWRDRIAARPAVQRAQGRIEKEFNPVAERTRKAATDEDIDRFFGITDKMPPKDFSRLRK